MVPVVAFLVADGGSSYVHVEGVARHSVTRPEALGGEAARQETGGRRKRLRQTWIRFNWHDPCYLNRPSLPPVWRTRTVSENLVVDRPEAHRENTIVDDETLVADARAGLTPRALFRARTRDPLERVTGIASRSAGACSGVGRRAG